MAIVSGAEYTNPVNPLGHGEEDCAVALQPISGLDSYHCSNYLPATCGRVSGATGGEAHGSRRPAFLDLSASKLQVNRMALMIRYPKAYTYMTLVILSERCWLSSQMFQDMPSRRHRMSPHR
ncbi:hypothetical protein BT67DRAFT_241368 [Trichocladium antarcticum]|uniref:Uncharacterized protein n=1 Tax=Trichocladium antarcticum TaxID=1450529 RepID=A0AAN6UBR8_9PEZI|nr:hypothetical protein BT67DRAFT_241368 [Trichocladium antarcticum]